MLVLVGLAIAVVITALSPQGGSTTVSGAVSGESGADERSGGAGGSGAGVDGAGDARSRATIYVHILGEVARPGLYQLGEGDRAVDAVAAAGGFTDRADPASVNLARFLTDGEQIIVPELGAAPAPAAGDGGSGGAAGAQVAGKVNLNTADSAALETLPRIGPAMAERILSWRDENGRFEAVEDLMSVSGIGEKTFEALRDLVTV